MLKLLCLSLLGMTLLLFSPTDSLPEPAGELDDGGAWQGDGGGGPDGPDDLHQDLLRQLSEVDQSPITDESMRSTPFPDNQTILHKRMNGGSRPGRDRCAGPGGSQSSPCDDHGPAKVLDRQFVCYSYSSAEGSPTCYYNTTGSYDDACHDFDIIRMKSGTVNNVRSFHGQTGISGKSVNINKDVQVEVRNGSMHSDTGHGPTSRPTLQINSPRNTVEVRKFRYI